METPREETVIKRLKGSVKRFFEELKKDSVASNPAKPVDCCRPPEPPEPRQQ